jgi:putative SOS response-associated peptidase YedK
MCGRYTLTNPDDVAARFGLGALSETAIQPRFNVSPSQMVPVPIMHREGNYPIVTWQGSLPFGCRIKFHNST